MSANPTACKGCGKRPDDLEEYVEMAEEEGMTPQEFVRSEEGTFNRDTGAFWCTACYIRAGMPLGVA